LAETSGKVPYLTLPACFASESQVSNDAGGARGDAADAALVARAREGDTDAQDALIRRYADDVYRVTFRILGDSDLAQDAAQEAFMNALHGLRGFRGEASFRTWLLRVALNAARTLGRRQTRRREIPLVAASAEPAPGRNIAEAVAERSESAQLEALLAELPPKQRMAVILRTQSGLSYAEIGQAIDCSEGSARVNYHLGIKRLKELAEGL
jgi:RNA polymerase sigma-70 factor, ECF subfamily